jgi:hypothetical protein
MHNPPPGKDPTNFIVWIEPERVSGGSYIATHFPEKLLGGGSLVNLGDKDMRDYIIEFVSTAVEEFELDTFRTDFNIPPLAGWRSGDAAIAAKLAPPPPPGPPARTCPKVTLVNNSDCPAGQWGPPGTVDICEFSAEGLDAAGCGAACCAINGTDAKTKCSKFVFVPGADHAPTVGGACPGKKACNTHTHRHTHTHTHTHTQVRKPATASAAPAAAS